MCSSFYGQGLLLPLDDQLERQQQHAHQGDLADMVRSSVNGPHRRGSVDIYHPQVSVCSNHDQIWSLTSAVDIDDEIRVDHSTTADDQHTPLRLVDHLPNNNNNNLSNSSMFLSSSPQHLPIVTSSRGSMMQTDHLANQTSCYLQYSSTTSNRFTLKDNTAAGPDTSSGKPPINCNVFSQMLHISSTWDDDMLAPAPPSSIMTSSFALAAGVVSSSSGDDHLTNINYSPSGGSSMAMLRNINEDPNCSISCATASASDCTLLHISSPRNNPAAIKRSRKSLSKKVVCVPAPAPANSRPSGEVVPSDLWAWRKYGQKPIKGSPYPRGYYRCSSSKGCSARKQVERSRTDPNMLVITYNSDHNHPWPTQRNALAGSTRSKNTCASSYSWTSGVAVNDHQMKRRSSSGSDELIKPPETAVVMIKQQQKADDHDDVDALSVQDHSNDQRLADNSSGDYEEDEHYWRCRPRTIELEEYNEPSVQEDDFFAELGEIAGKDHNVNGFSSFLMDYSSSDKAVI